MTKGNHSLDECLEKLFEKSGSFKVSIALIQKLAQQLRLETFIDKHAFSMNTDPIYQELKPQRLSIAGSLILLDIDFTDDDKILNVELSVGDHMMEREAGVGKETEEPEVSETEDDGVTKVRFDFHIRKRMFLGLKMGDKRPLSEEILLEGLREQTTLGTFPQNLKYLADLDRLSTSGADAFQVVDEMAFLLNYFYEKEKALTSDDWETEKGWSTVFGKVYVNDVERLKLGIMLDFWQEGRHIVREYLSEDSQEKLSLGKTYKALIGIASKDTLTYPTIIDDPDSEWSNTKNEQKYIVSCKNNLYQSAKDNSLILKLDFNEPVILPEMLIEYLGLVDSKIATETSSFLSSRLNDIENLNYMMDVNKYNVHINLVQDLPTNFVLMDQISISRMNALIKIIPCIRNFLVLNSILESLKVGKLVRSINGSIKQGGIKENSYSDIDTSQSTDAKQKLKESLKLSNDVTDEELLGLSAITRNRELLGTITYDDLDLFMSNEDDKTDDIKVNNDAEPESNTKNYFVFKIQEIDFESQFNDLVIEIKGRLNLNDVEASLRISNGTICRNKGGDGMDVDDDKIKKLIEGLNLTENIVKVLEFVYFR